MLNSTLKLWINFTHYKSENNETLSTEEMGALSSMLIKVSAVLNSADMPV